MLSLALAAASTAWAQGTGDLSLGQAATLDDPTPLQAGRLVVIDRERVLAESESGRALLAELDAATVALERENAGIEETLRAEERDLTERRPTMEADAFRAEAEAFDARVQEIRGTQDAKGRDLIARREVLRQRFWDEAVPVLALILQERGAVVVLDRDDVFLSSNSADITEEAIARIDATGTREPSSPDPQEPAAPSSGGEAAEPASPRK